MADDFERLGQAWGDFKQAVWNERRFLLTGWVLTLLIVEGVVIAATLLF